MVQFLHPYMTAGKIIALNIWTFVGKVMSLLSNTLSRFLIAFIPRSKHLLIPCLKSLSSVILEPKKIKSVTVSIFVSPSMPWSDETRCHVLVFFFFFPILSSKPASLLSSFTFIKRVFFSSFSLYSFTVVSSTYLRLFIFFPGILIPACDSFSPGFCMMYFA